MILQVLGLDGRPLLLPASRVVIMLDDGVTPVAAAVQHAAMMVEVGQAADRHGRPNPEFAGMLEACGLDRTIIVGRAPLRPLADMEFNPR